jgi:hypothetical protein
MVFAALGALVILAGAIKLLFFNGSGATVETATYTAICGAISEAIAALLLAQAERANRRMVELFDRGRHDRDLATAQRIAECLPDDAVSVRTRAWLVFQLAGAADPDASTRAFFAIHPPSPAAREDAVRRRGKAISRPVSPDNGLCNKEP